MGKSADPAANPRLRLAWDKALGANMMKDTMERAAKRGVGAGEGEDYLEILYEGYGPGGVAVLVYCMTDNHTRTVADVRHAFSKMGGNLGTDGSVAYLFKKEGVLFYPPGTPEDALLDAALTAGADDVRSHDDGAIEVIIAPDAYMSAKEALTAAGWVPEESEIAMRAALNVPVDGEVAEKLVKMIDLLEDLDDVQTVFHNAEIPDEAYS